ncbi:unnamed protein product [Strongylus vulgaris]|uniref:Uncharacterized protein n=1 Tax=Strongylus vulgaris TaxID=40348 RepID=A0A3P7JCP2_STRVU|nr:unnamed protein product [Strongylus vulgaris]
MEIKEIRRAPLPSYQGEEIITCVESSRLDQ